MNAKIFLVAMLALAACASAVLAITSTGSALTDPINGRTWQDISSEEYSKRFDWFVTKDAIIAARKAAEAAAAAERKRREEERRRKEEEESFRRSQFLADGAAAIMG